LGWFDSLDGFGSLDPAEDIQSPELNCVDGQTIRSQAGQSYTQWVPMHDVDSAQTICPIGHSDRRDSPYRASTRALWAEGKLHPAPLSRDAVEKLAIKRLRLNAASGTESAPSNRP
jgi:acyl-homoserine lactone acylase PvdQ